METPVTEADLIAAVLAAAEPRGDRRGLRSKEIRAATGWGRQRVIDVLEAMLVAGRVERRKITIEAVNGYPAQGVEYVLVTDASGQQETQPS